MKREALLGGGGIFFLEIRLVDSRNLIWPPCFTLKITGFVDIGGVKPRFKKNKTALLCNLADYRST